MTASGPAPVVVGLDVGTTGVKAAAFGLGSSWERVAIREYPLLEPVPGEQVQDPDAIVAATTQALADCVAQCQDGQVVGISVSAGMHGLIALDAGLRPLTPLITWADGRARDEARSLHQTGLARELHATTGAPVHPMTPLTKLMWFARHDPATWAAARWWVGLKDYVLLWLTGRLVTELSSASGTGLLDMSTRGWSRLALEVSGVTADHLPEILPTTATLTLAPATAHAVGLAQGTPVVVGAADGPLANVGTGALTRGIAGLSLGTSGAVRAAVDDPRVDDGGTLFCYALTESKWVVGGAISNGASVVRWLAASLLPDVSAAAGGGEIDRAVMELANTVPVASEGLVMLPYLLPERAPLWDPDLPGAYVGLRRHHTRAHLVRATIEGVCLQMRLILDALDEVEPVTSVRATGGAFRSPLWCQVMAAILDRPFAVMEGAEGTALGAAALGLVALGCTTTLGEALARLSQAATPEPRAVDSDPLVVAAYDALRRSVPTLVGELDRVAGAFDRSGAEGGRSPTSGEAGR
jgi:gluconokinase